MAAVRQKIRVLTGRPGALCRICFSPSPQCQRSQQARPTGGGWRSLRQNFMLRNRQLQKGRVKMKPNVLSEIIGKPPSCCYPWSFLVCVVTGQRVAAFQTRWCSQLDRDKFYHASWDLTHVYIIIYVSKEHGNLCWTPLSFWQLVGILVRIFLENCWYDWLLTQYGSRPWDIGSQGIMKIIISNLKWCNPKVALSPGDKWLLL